MTRTANVVGLDIGSTALRAVELTSRRKNSLSVRRFYEIPLPRGAVTRGEIAQPEIVAAALKRLWSEGKFKSKKVVLGNGNQRTLIRDLSVPKASIEHIRESLPFHVQGTLQIPADASLLDFYPISETTGEQGQVTHGLLVSTEKDPILRNVHYVERAGLIPVDVDLIPFALSRLLVYRTAPIGTTALVEVGAHTTSIAIALQGIPHFVRIIPLGGADLTAALESGLGMEATSAEQLKRTLRVGADLANRDEIYSSSADCTCGRCLADLKTVDDPRVQEILRATVLELLSGIRNTIIYFNNTRPEESVDEVILTGGGTALAGFAEALSETIGLPVRDATPLESFTPHRKSDVKKWQSSRATFSVALALAMRGSL